MSITIGGSVLGGSRAIDEAEKIVRDFQDFQVRSVDEEEGEIEAVVSTRDVDRYKSIILPRSFDRLMERFLANPMFLWQHNRNAPLGTVKRIWRDENQVYAVFKFDLKNRFAAEVFRLYKERILRAFSISGSALEIFYSWMSPKERAKLDDIDEAAALALEAEEAYYVITELELFEISAVTVPGNHKALSRALEAGTIDKEFADQFGFDRGLTPTEKETRKESPMDRVPKELIERMDAVTKLAGELVEERKAQAKAPEGLTEAQRAEVRQTVLDTLAEVFGDEE